PTPTPTAPAEPARVMQRLQAPVIDVPVSPSSAAAAGAVTVRVVPPGAGLSTPGGVGADAAGAAPGGATGLASPAALSAAPAAAPPAIASPRTPPLPGLPELAGPYRVQPRQRSLSDMANEQLRRGRPRDKWAEGMEDAASADCLRAGRTETLGGLLAVPGLAARALQGRCPR
ncbi:MAG: hypothetical protein Q7T63_19760, partial [Burkholderiaceae bacterium]|nr:hypothetical protein [Burkholderiaceae bacterium]